MTTSNATLQVDTLTTEDRSVLERVLGCSLDGLKSIEVQHVPMKQIPCEEMIRMAESFWDGVPEDEVEQFHQELELTLS